MLKPIIILTAGGMTMKNRYSRIVLNTLEGQDFEITYGMKQIFILKRG